MKWAYGVTTVPSRIDTFLPKTLASLARAGFDKPRLFVDGPADMGRFGLEATVRQQPIRTFGNWFLGMVELNIREPQASLYLMFQDDLLACANLREYLTSCKYPNHGYCNLYTFPVNQDLAKDRIGWYPSNQLGRGAVALMFDRPAVTAMLASTYLAERPRDARGGWQSIDGGIVTAMKNAGFKEYVHNPSLVQHIGDISSMGHGKFPQASSFRGEEFDAMEILR